MNAKQREIIAGAYETLLNNLAHHDPYGQLEDAPWFFRQISQTDDKLKELLMEKFDEIFPEDEFPY